MCVTFFFVCFGGYFLFWPCGVFKLKSARNCVTTQFHGNVQDCACLLFELVEDISSEADSGGCVDR